MVLLSLAISSLVRSLVALSKDSLKDGLATWFGLSEYLVQNIKLGVEVTL